VASDRRPYVKIPDAVLREPWDDSTLADLVRLQIWLHTRWARHKLPAERAGRAFLGPQDMMLVTHTTNVSRARARLLALQQRTGGVTLAVEKASQGRYQGVNIDWPKFPKEQGYQDRDCPNSGAGSGESRASYSGSGTGYKKRGAHAPLKSRSTHRQPPSDFEPDGARDRLFRAALVQLKSEEDRDYSVEEIEARMVSAEEGAA
jgi:hypothetical protein